MKGRRVSTNRGGVTAARRSKRVLNRGRKSTVPKLSSLKMTNPNTVNLEDIVLNGLVKLGDRSKKHHDINDEMIQEKRPSIRNAAEDNQATLLTVPPHFVFAYWNISPKSIIQTSEKVGAESHLVIRIYDISKTENLSKAPRWDMDIFDKRGNSYLKLEKLDQKLAMAVGLKNRARRFVSIKLAESNYMPEYLISEPGPMKWIVRVDGEDQIRDISSAKLKPILGPYFYDLFSRGRFKSIINSNLEGLFNVIHSSHPGK